jgi:hypothetical protein
VPIISNTVLYISECIKRIDLLSNMLAQAYNPITWKLEAGGSQVQSQRGLHSKTLSYKLTKEKGGKCYF